MRGHRNHHRGLPATADSYHIRVSGAESPTLHTTPKSESSRKARLRWTRSFCQDDSREMTSSEASALIAFPQASATAVPSLARTNSDSDYLVLRRVDSNIRSVSLPRPRFWYVLPLLAVLDACCSVAVALPVIQKTSTIVLLVWSCLRAVAVGAATCSVRIREMGWITVACVVVSTAPLDQTYQADIGRPAIRTGLFSGSQSDHPAPRMAEWTQRPSSHLLPVPSNLWHVALGRIRNYCGDHAGPQPVRAGLAKYDSSTLA